MRWYRQQYDGIDNNMLVQKEHDGANNYMMV